MNTPLSIQRTNISFGTSSPSVVMLRTELHSAFAPGNKWFKLKYNIQEALDTGKVGILSFGGAHSNHLHALAASCQQVNLQAVGIIYTQSNQTDSHTIRSIKKLGMKVIIVSDKAAYDRMMHPNHLSELLQKFGDFLVVPPGGNNANGLKGAMEILSGVPKFKTIAVPVGYGTTISGLIRSVEADVRVIGFPAVSKDEQLIHRISAMLSMNQNSKWELNWDYTFGGFGKKDDDLIDFMNTFYLEHSIKLDPIYTGKMMFGMFKQLKSGALESEGEILCIHTGGLQGIAGFNQRYPGALIYTSD